MAAKAPLLRGPEAGIALPRLRVGLACAVRGARLRAVLRAAILGVLVAIGAAPGRSCAVRCPARGDAHSQPAYAASRTRVKVGAARWTGRGTVRAGPTVVDELTNHRDPRVQYQPAVHRTREVEPARQPLGTREHPVASGRLLDRGAGDEAAADIMQRELLAARRHRRDKRAYAD